MYIGRNIPFPAGQAPEGLADLPSNASWRLETGMLFRRRCICSGLTRQTANAGSMEPGPGAVTSTGTATLPPGVEGQGAKAPETPRRQNTGLKCAGRIPDRTHATRLGGG